MDQDEIMYRLALTMIPNIGAITAKKLIAYVGSPEGVFRENVTTLQKIPGIGAHLSNQTKLAHILTDAEAEIQSMQNSRISWSYYQDSDYPWRLKNCEDGPLFLFYRGENIFNRTKFLSVVGTRSASNYGRELCRSIISALAAKHPELVIVSGLAYGIDITAHRAALEYGIDTIAVLAHGLNTIYPAVHTEVAKKMIGKGGLATDFHSNIKPERNNFLRRNRIIAGLSDATLVIESGQKGGALITAEIAASYNREVFALPGRVTDSSSAGCNRLIKRNIAALVEGAEDIEYNLQWESNTTVVKRRPMIDELISEKEHLILKEIIHSPEIGPEILSIRTKVPIHETISLLLQMELRNWITLLPGNRYKTEVQLPE